MNRPRLIQLSAGQIVGVYLILGIGWIAASQWLITEFAGSPASITRLHTLNGWIFVGLSSLCIYGVIRLRQEQFERSQERLRQASEKLQVFHRIFRHNIRNDLSIIEGYIQLVQDQLHEREPRSYLRTAMETARDIGNTSEKMQLVNQVDLLAKSEDGVVDLVELTDKAVARVRDEFPDVEISVKTPTSALVRGNRSLEAAVTELLDNAVRHNHRPREDRTVELLIQRVNKTHVILRIADNGPGLPDQEHQALEQKIETALTHVSGVGLWVTLWILEYNDATLSFDVSPTGTTAIVQFRSSTQLPSIQEVSDTLGKLYN